VTVEDMERKGLLLPREEWQDEARATNVARLPLIGIFVAYLAGAVLMYAGDGKALTWIGLAVFLVALAGFTLVSLRAIGAQRE
jgi:cytochrome oxidase assembly protein ShyY1